ncbi:MAG: TIM-barrel domain-containing protein, partial [Candidatus Cryptobacteroides sp.]
WVQMGAFNPLSRIHHEGNNAVEPWMFGEQAEGYVKDAISLKYSLLPYIYSYAREAHDTGLPIMRAMFLEYPYDSQTFSTDNQFMFGQELLVAPVVKRNAKKRNVYLPEGEWIDFNDMKTVYDGEQWVSVDSPLSTIPMFVRKGSIIPRMPVMDYTRQKAVYPITFQIFPADEGESASFSLYEDDGQSLGYLRDEFIRTNVTCKSIAEGFEIEVGERTGKVYQVPGQRDFIFELHTDKALKKIAIDGKKAGKAVTSINKKTGVYTARIPDDGKKHIITLYE